MADLRDLISMPGGLAGPWVVPGPAGPQANPSFDLVPKPAATPSSSPKAGPFDDLIPAAPQAAAPAQANPFADLVPTAPATAQTPSPSSGTGSNDNPFADLVPPPVNPSDPMGQSLTSGPDPSLLERFGQNVAEGFRGTSLGAATNYLATRLAPDSSPIDPNTGQPLGTTPRAQVTGLVNEQNAQAANFPSYTDDKGTFPINVNPDGAGQPDQIVQAPNYLVSGPVALAGQLAGGLASPESMVAGPEASSAIREGAAAVPQIAKAAAVQAGVQGTANAGAQGLNIAAAGTQQDFSPAEVAQSAGMGAVIGAVHPIATTALDAARGARPEISAAPHAEAPSPAGAFGDLVPKAPENPVAQVASTAPEPVAPEPTAPQSPPP